MEITLQEPPHFAHWYDNETKFYDRFPQLLMPPTTLATPYYLDPQADKLMLENLSLEQVIERQEFFAMQEFMALNVELESPIGNLTREQARQLLIVQESLVQMNVRNLDTSSRMLIHTAYAALYKIVDPNFASWEPFAELRKMAEGGEV